MREAFHASLQIPLMAKRWAELQQLGVTEDQYLNLTHQLTNIAVAFVTLLYQGAMVIYYARRQKAVDLALPEE
jgi:heme A synthase